MHWWSFSLQVVKLLYDDDIIEEDAVLVWADEKQMAEEHERKYSRKLLPSLPGFEKLNLRRKRAQ